MPQPDPLPVVVEVPRGSRNKYEFDPELGRIKLDRFLFSSVVYPVDYGFVPDTLGADGDPLDAMVCVSEPTFPGCAIPSIVVGLFRMHDEHGLDDKLLCVPAGDPRWNTARELEDVSQPLRDEIEHFFAVYKHLEGKPVEVQGWSSRAEALGVLDAARRRAADGAA